MTSGHKPKKGYRYTPEIVRFLKENIQGKTFRVLTELLNTHFRLEFTERQVRSAAVLNGLKNQLGPGHKHKPIGSERKGALGYIHIRFQETGIHKKDWKSKNSFLWEKEHGPIPAGHYVIFADGDKGNFESDNLILVSASELLRMNQSGLIFRNKELTKTGLAIVQHRAALNKAIKRQTEE